METTTFVLTELDDPERAQGVRSMLDDEPGVARVLVRADRGEVYVKHSAAKAPRRRLLDRLREEGFSASVKHP